MFFHVFKYGLKINFRVKEIVFWAFIFPIILGTCFYAAFSSISTSTESFNTINVAIVLENSDSDIYFKEIADSLSDDENDLPLLNPTYCSSNEAGQLLEKEEVTGIITLSGGIPSLMISGDGINESILKEILNKYLQSVSMLSDIDVNDTAALSKVLSAINNDISYIKELKLTDGNTDVFTNYYYSLIAMCCLMCFSGTMGSMNIKANLSSVGIRKNLSTTRKSVIILGTFMSSYIIQAIASIILIIYLNYVLKVNLGGSLPLITLTALVGSFAGVSTGTFIGALPKLSESLKIALNIIVSLFSCFLSGLMIGDIKYIIQDNLPLLDLLNPAAAISNALYSLNIYDTYNKFIQSISVLTIYSIVLIFTSYLMTRRETYASL
ncbi:MAG: ABC transporter permease [Lachnospiraceae bacterium]|nr:ABC transporter permease [Lachnospiraceae bacterium]